MASSSTRAQLVLVEHTFTQPAEESGSRSPAPCPAPTASARPGRGALPGGRPARARPERLLEPRLAPEAELGHPADWAGKLTGATARIAGLLRLAAAPPPAWVEPVPAGVVEAAARLGHYFLTHALAVFDAMGADPHVEDARVILDWIARTHRTAFSRRDAFTALSRARFRKIAELDPGLAVLEDHGYIRRRPAPDPARGRPPSPVWEVHPRAAETAEITEAPA